MTHSFLTRRSSYLRPQRPRPVQLDRGCRTVQAVRGPQPVHVLVDETRPGRRCRVEAPIGVRVRKTKGEPAAGRPEAGAEQRVDGDRTAQLVPMGARVDPTLAPGAAAADPVHVVAAGHPATPQT